LRFKKAGILFLKIRILAKMPSVPKKVHAIILAAGGLKKLPIGQQQRFHTSLEWLIHAYRKNGIENITVIGGKQIEKLGKQFEDVQFYFNPEWQKTHTLASLYLAKEKLLDGDCIISYADTVYRPKLIKKLLKEKKGDISVLIDTNWKERYPRRTKSSLNKAEKIWLDSSGKVKKAQRGFISKEPDGELTGIMYFSAKGGRKIVDIFEKTDPKKTFHEAKNIGKAGFTDLLQELTKKGAKISSVLTQGEWAELDSPEDFGRFIFGTKSQTLERLKPILKHGLILPQYTFTVGKWRKNKKSVIAATQKYFKDPLIVVRSSSQREDSLEESAAGKFTSIIGIDRRNPKRIEVAVNEVVKSFGKDVTEDDQILIQPQVLRVAMSGVMFTCDIKTGAPYYVVNYDTSGSTETITGGKGGAHNLHYICKQSKVQPKDKRLSKLLKCAKELEKLTGSETIDIEFAFDKKGKLFIFQTRPLASKTVLNEYYSSDIEPCLDRAKDIIGKRLKDRPHLSGKTTVLGDMPDWNPAELIGSQPRPMSSSLFEYLITRKAWRTARSILGYFDPAPERLMVMLAGHPYIDVRNSLNSYTPAQLDPKIREKLVNECLKYLKKNPDSHDKLEFEVATTCFTPYIEDRVKRWKSAGFTPKEITEFKKVLLNHTEKIIRGEFHSVDDLIEMTKHLDERRMALTSAQSDFTLLDTIKFLLDDCIEFGTVPFSSLARLAFMGSTFMKAFKDKGAISEESYHGFLNSITTVASEMGDNLAKVGKGSLPLKTFLKEYGHLRPGTYEITSYRYDEKPKLYFSGLKKKSQSKAKKSKKFNWKPGEKQAMQKLLTKSGMHLKVDEVLEFTKDAIAGRELGKFIFSRNVSDLLSLIVRWGEEHDISRDDLSYLDLNHMMILAGMPDRESIHNQFKLAVQNARDEYAMHKQVIMPQLIFDPSDIEHITVRTNRPNFITNKRISGSCVYLDGMKGKPKIDGKIVLIESADPGYDWIFTHNISGLITKYGGAASHMAIRSAEFGLPAAIGCGAVFESLKENHVIHLDCENHTIS